MIALQYWFDFCHSSTWINYGYTYVPAFLVAQTVKHLSAMQETWVLSLGRENPLEKEMAAYSRTLDGKSHERRSLVGYSP